MEFQGIDSATMIDSDLKSLSINTGPDIQGIGGGLRKDSANHLTTDLRTVPNSSEVNIRHVDLPILTDPLLEKGLLSDMEDVHDKGLKGAAFSEPTSQLNFHDETYSLYKASSVPHLHSKSSKSIPSTGSQPRKKTSEASPLPNPMLLAQLRDENQLLQNRLRKHEEERKEIVGINHAWDTQYHSLNQKYSVLEGECRTLKDELVNKEKELSSKEQKITRLTKKIELLILNSCNDEPEKGLWKNVEEKEYAGDGQKYDDNILTALKRTEGTLAEEREGRIIAQQQARDFKIKCEYLEGLLAQQTQQRAYLQNELKRLSTANIDIKTTSGREALGNDIDLLKQQLEVYAEDFNAEKDEKQRLLKENDQLKRKISSFTEEKQNLIRQLQIYEEDFQCEREKRINLMRRTIYPEDEFTPRPRKPPASLSSPRSHDDPQQKWKEYCCLVVEKEQILDRINELETQGITKYNGRGPSYQHQPPGRLPLSRTSNGDVTRYHGDNIGHDERNDWPSIYGVNRAPSESDTRGSHPLRR